MKKAFVVKSKGGWWNLIVQDDSTGEWFLYDQSLTNLEDAVGIMKENGFQPEYEPTIEDWMSEDSEEDEPPPPENMPTITDIVVYKKDLSEEARKSTAIAFVKEDLIEWYELGDEDIYKYYYLYLLE